MTREFIKEKVPGISDEALTALLNEHNAEKEEAKKSVKKPDDSEEIKELRRKAKAFDDAEKEKMTAEQRLEEALKEAEAAKVESKRILARTKAEAEFVKAGLAEDDYKALLDDVVSVDGDEEATLSKVQRIATLIKTKTDAAIKTTTENLMKNSSQPQADGNGGENKDVDKAEALAKEIAGVSASSDSYTKAFDYYK